MLILIITPILILAFCFIIGIVIGLIKSRKDLLDIWRNLLTIVTAYLKNTKVVGYGLISISLFLLASLFPPILIVYLLVAGIWFIKK